jgi:predicted ATPase with chaperone activity
MQLLISSSSPIFLSLSGPLLDRIDLRVTLERPSLAELDPSSGELEGTEVVAARVAQARERAAHRYRNEPWEINSQVPGPMLREDIQFPMMHVNYSQMIHSKSQHVAQIESFALLGRLLICVDMTFQMKPMWLQHLCIEMAMVHGKPVNRSASPTNHFHCW